MSLGCISLVSASPALDSGVAAWEAQDYRAALQIWRPLAEKGEPEAMLFVAFAYRTGRGVDQSNDQAFAWYQRAAEAGLPEAQFELALMHELGLGTEVDAGAAAAWYAQATGGEFCPSELPAGGRLGER